MVNLIIFQTYIKNQISIFGVYQYPDMPFFCSKLNNRFWINRFIGILIIILGFNKVKNIDNYNNNILGNCLILGALFTLIFDNHGIGMWVI